MNYNRLFFTVIALLSFEIGYSQSFFVSTPKASFEGDRLSISYDIVSKNANGRYFVWVEIESSDGQKIKLGSLTGDVGEKITAGRNKNIVWVPAKDSIFLDEEIFVEVKAEQYVRPFKKSAMLAYSAVLPGLGQSKVNQGSYWWTGGLAVYGMTVGSVIMHNKYVDTYSKYKRELWPSTRKDLLARSESQKTISDALLVSAGGLWAANMIWMSLVPNEYKPLKYAPVSMNASFGGIQGVNVLSLRISF